MSSKKLTTSTKTTSCEKATLAQEEARKYMSRFPRVALKSRGQGKSRRGPSTSRQPWNWKNSKNDSWRNKEKPLGPRRPNRCPPRMPLGTLPCAPPVNLPPSPRRAKEHLNQAFKAKKVAEQKVSEKKNSEPDLPPFWFKSIDQKSGNVYYYNKKTRVSTWDDPLTLTQHFLCTREKGVGCRRTANMSDRVGVHAVIRYRESVTGTATADGRWLCVVSKVAGRHGTFVPLLSSSTSSSMTSDVTPDVTPNVEFFKERSVMTDWLVGSIVEFKRNPPGNFSSVIQNYVEEGAFAGLYKVLHTDVLPVATSTPITKSVEHYHIDEDFLAHKTEYSGVALRSSRLFGCSIEYVPDMKIRCRWKNMRGALYNGTIKAKNDDGTYNVNYEDGDKETSVEVARLSNTPWEKNPGATSRHDVESKNSTTLRVLQWRDPFVQRAAENLCMKKNVFRVLQTLKQQRRVRAEKAACFQSWKFFVSEQRKFCCASLVLQKFFMHIIFVAKLKRMCGALRLQRFLHPLLRKRRMRKLRHTILIQQRARIMQCLVPPPTQPRSCSVGATVLVRAQSGRRQQEQQQQEGVVVEYSGGHSAKVQMLSSGGGTKNINVSELVLLPAGVQDVSSVLTVAFDDLVHNGHDVLDRCEASMMSSTRVIKRRARFLRMMMLELIEIWGDKIPSSHYFETVFEEQAKKLADGLTSFQTADAFDEESLLAINQRGGGFCLETFERRVKYWEAEWREPPLSSCSICCDYFLLPDYIPSSRITDASLLDEDTMSVDAASIVGCRVTVEWSLKMKYPGIFLPVESDGKHVVLYDDGDRRSYTLRVNKDGQIIAFNKDQETDVHKFFFEATKKPVTFTRAESKSKEEHRHGDRCSTDTLSCKTCLQEYCRVAIAEAPPLWNGISCFCGDCSTVIPDHAIKALFSSDSTLVSEYAALERKLRHRRISAHPNLRFCPNSECKKIPTNVRALNTNFRSLQLTGRREDCAKSAAAASQCLYYRCIEEKGVCCRNSHHIDDRDKKEIAVFHNERIAGIPLDGVDEMEWFIVACDDFGRNGKYLPMCKEGVGELFKTITEEEFFSPRIVVNEVAVVDLSVGLSCWRCDVKLCPKCGSTAHDDDDETKEGEGCVAMHDSRLLGMVSTRKDWVRCPKCQYVLERTKGCDHMTCRCGAEFCFVCGAMPQCGSTCKKK